MLESIQQFFQMFTEEIDVLERNLESFSQSSEKALHHQVSRFYDLNNKEMESYRKYCQYRGNTKGEIIGCLILNIQGIFKKNQTNNLKDKIGQIKSPQGNQI